MRVFALLATGITSAREYVNMGSDTDARIMVGYTLVHVHVVAVSGQPPTPVDGDPTSRVGVEGTSFGHPLLPEALWTLELSVLRVGREPGTRPTPRVDRPVYPEDHRPVLELLL